MSSVYEKKLEGAQESRKAPQTSRDRHIIERRRF